ncbi:MAG: exonuclease SbcCD subunit D [Actinomycetaceae bacterium]|nr:exonuclease SbcCD subunit D [Actinomycetaceae bacterium]
MALLLQVHRYFDNKKPQVPPSLCDKFILFHSPAVATARYAEVMKIIHSSDWHLGRSFHGFDISDSHKAFIRALAERASEEQPDAIIIAGDFFDRGVPSVETITIARQALEQLTAIAPVIITSGNHDSSVRLGWLKSFLIPQLRICSDITDVASPIYLRCRTFDTAPRIIEAHEVREAFHHGAEVGVLYGFPYLHPDFTRAALSNMVDAALERSHQSVMSAAVDMAAAHYRDVVVPLCKTQVASVIIAHAFITGGEESDSERDISVGGLNNVATSTFNRPLSADNPAPDSDAVSTVPRPSTNTASPVSSTVSDNSLDTTSESHTLISSDEVAEAALEGPQTSPSCIDYVALGHLHRPQIPQRRIDNTQPDIVYCGSPIAFSFSEAGYTKVQYIATITRGKPAILKTFDTPVLRPVSRLRGTLAELTDGRYNDCKDHLVEVTVTDEQRPLSMYRQVKTYFPYAASIMWESSTPPCDNTPVSHRRIKAHERMDIIESFMLKTGGGTQLTPEEKDVLKTVYEEVNDEVWQ